MRGRRNQIGAAGGRRIRRLAAAVTGSPFDFSTDDDERVDPVEFLAIRADDELLDGVSAGRLVGPAYTAPFGSGLDSGYADDQHVLALLAELRAEIDSVAIPELVSIDEACAAIAAGRRAVRPRRRLMSVTAAAAVTVMALSGAALAAGNAQPGDALWGVSAVLDANRARSVEAAYRIDTALATARQALAEGRVTEARGALASVTPDLAKVSDPERKVQLSRTARNLTDTADEAREGERVQTDEHGTPSDPGWAGHHERGGVGSTSADPGGAASAGRWGPQSASGSPAPRPVRPDPSELFGPGRTGFPGAPVPPQPASPRPDPANPAEGTPTDPGAGKPGGPGAPGSGAPGDPGAGTPGYPGVPGDGARGVPAGTPGTPGSGTPGNSGNAGRPSSSPGTPADARGGKPTGSDQKHGQPSKPSTTGTTTPPANSSGCSRGSSGNGCTGSGGKGSTGN
jgi:hypothetical protein